MCLTAWNVNWGDIPTWISAVATLGALVAAGYAVRASWQVLGIERDNQGAAKEADAIRREAAERGEQADGVAAWTAWAAAKDDGGRLRYRGWGAWVANQSMLPIYDLTIQFHLPNGKFLAKKDVGVVPPQTTQFHGWPKEIKQDEPPVSEISKPDMRVEVTFRDTGGRRWVRDRYGILHLTGRDTYIRMPTIEVPALIGDFKMRAEDEEPEGEQNPQAQHGVEPELDD